VDVNDSYSGIQSCDLNIHKANTNAVVKSASVSPSGGKCSYTYTLGETGVKYLAAWNVYDNSTPANYAADINSSTVLKTVAEQPEEGDESGGGAVTGGGGGGGGGGGAVSLSIDEWSIDRRATVGKPTPISLVISNHGVTTRVVVNITITRLGEQEFFTSEKIGVVNEGETRRVVLSDEWVPGNLGSYVLGIMLMSVNERTVFAELSESFGITGELRYDIAVDCTEKIVIPNSNAGALIEVLNLGDYYEDVDLSWGVKAPDGTIIGEGNIPIAVQTGKSREFRREAFIPDNAETGTYTFYAEVEFEGEKRRGSCAFTVEKNQEYYNLKIEELEKRLEELESIIDDKRKAGISTEAVDNEIATAKKLLAAATAQTRSGDFKELDKKITALGAVLDDLFPRAENLGEIAFFGIVIRFILLLLILILVVCALVLLTLVITKKVRKEIMKIKGERALKQAAALDQGITALENSIALFRGQAEKLWLAAKSFAGSIGSVLVSVGGAIVVLVPATWSVLKDYYSKFTAKAATELRHRQAMVKRRVVLHGRQLHPVFRGMIIIEGWKFDKPPSVGKPLAIAITVSGLGNAKPRLLVFVEILRGVEIEFSASEVIETTEANAQDIALAEQWTPLSAGRRKIEIRVSSTDETRTHSTMVEAFEVEGKRRLDLSLGCLEKTIKPGNHVNGKVTVSNRGDYDQSIMVDYWVEAPDGTIIGKARSSASLEHGRSDDLIRRALIPAGAAGGTYYFNAEADYGAGKKQAKCSFEVEGPQQEAPLKKEPETTKRIVRRDAFDSVEDDMKSLEQVLNGKRTEGIRTDAFRKKAGEVKNRIAKAHAVVKLREFRLFDNVIAARIDKEIKALIEMAKRLR
jgi:hypothetical protein